jgi:hypothetical protein
MSRYDTPSEIMQYRQIQACAAPSPMQKISNERSVNQAFFAASIVSKVAKLPDDLLRDTSCPSKLLLFFSIRKTAAPTLL